MKQALPYVTALLIGLGLGAITMFYVGPRPIETQIMPAACEDPGEALTMTCCFMSGACTWVQSGNDNGPSMNYGCPPSMAALRRFDTGAVDCTCSEDGEAPVGASDECKAACAKLVA